MSAKSALHQRDAGLDTERRFPVYIHTVLVISCASRSITVNGSTGIVPHGVPVAVIGVGKGNRTNIAAANAAYAGITDNAVTAANARAAAFLNNLRIFIVFIIPFASLKAQTSHEKGCAPPLFVL